MAQAKSADVSQQWVYSTDLDLPPGKPIIGKFTRIRERYSSSSSSSCDSSCSSSRTESRVSSTRTTGNSRSPYQGAGKRKRTSEQEDARKRQRISPTDCSEETQVIKGTKRRASEEDDRPSKRKKQEGSSSPQKSCTAMTDEEASRLEFAVRYEQLKLLGKGGFGSVYAGLRRADNVPVAIKHITKDKIIGEKVSVEGRMLPLEVAIMMRIGREADAAGKQSAAISLLDHYDLEQELILVLERPDPCVDLFEHIELNGGTLQEKEGKNIFKQLVHAAQELQVAEVFHRDIKIENVLIETGSEIPKARLIDFGLSCFAKLDSSLDVHYGTKGQVHPEGHMSLQYKPGPGTVWQLGVVLFEMLQEDAFDTVNYFHKKLPIRESLSKDCQNIMRLCLSLEAEKRPSLEQILQHPWLQ